MSLSARRRRRPARRPRAASHPVTTGRPADDRRVRRTARVVPRPWEPMPV